MVVWNVVSPAYFNGETLPRGSHDLVLASESDSFAHVGLPDSREQHTVIAPDLSNLPPGQRAVDPQHHPTDQQRPDHP
jgi:hypothetical protein